MWCTIHVVFIELSSDEKIDKAPFKLLNFQLPYEIVFCYAMYFLFEIRTVPLYHCMSI